MDPVLLAHRVEIEIEDVIIDSGKPARGRRWPRYIVRSLPRGWKWPEGYLGSDAKQAQTGRGYGLLTPSFDLHHDHDRYRPHTTLDPKQRASMVESGKLYRLVNGKAGNVLDLSGSDNKSLIGYDWHDGQNQKVRVLPRPWVWGRS